MKPKIDTVFMGIKGLCALVIGVFTPLGVSLAQYANTGQWPNAVTWWGVVIPACAVGGANALISFCSNTAGEWIDKRTPPPLA